MAVTRTYLYLVLVTVLVLWIFEGNCEILHHRKSNQLARYTEEILQSIEYITKPKSDIVIPIMMHLDKAMTRQMPKLPGTKRIKFKPKRILLEVEKIFNTRSLNLKVRLKLINLKVISNNTEVVTDENVSKYLQNYCAWQKKRKVENRETYFSVLLSGLDLYYINKNGQKVKQSTGRGYMGKMCSLDKSCTIMKWHPRDVTYLLAHEIAHSLGVYHDSVMNKCPRHGYIMASQYDRWRPPTFWSTCSKAHLKKFMSNKTKSWCIQPKIF